MTRRDDSMRLRHMLDHAVEAVEMAAGKERQDLKADRQFCLAMTRLAHVKPVVPQCHVTCVLDPIRSSERIPQELLPHITTPSLATGESRRSRLCGTGVLRIE